MIKALSILTYNSGYYFPFKNVQFEYLKFLNEQFLVFNEY